MAKKKLNKSFSGYHNVLRILIGVFFIIVAASKLNLIPNGLNQQEMFTPQGFAFISSLAATGYIFEVIGIFSLACAIAILANRYVGIAAVVLVPITLNFALFHVFLGFPHFSSLFIFFREVLSYLPLVMCIYLIYRERKKFSALLH